VPVPSKGLVQDPGLTPWVLVPFPTREEFDDMYKRSSPEMRDRYWQMLIERGEGASLADLGRRWGITRERVRQIEAKFLRRVSRQWKESNS
jgi:DNA-directed RNA polymerase sigma subunit (sigma70/sigma32)